MRQCWRPNKPNGVFHIQMLFIFAKILGFIAIPEKKESRQESNVHILKCQDLNF